MELWTRNCPVILPTFRLPHKFRDLLHAANLRHGTDGFTSPPKEGVLRIFFTLKVQRLQPGLNPRTWVLKARTLPLDHRSLSFTIEANKALHFGDGIAPTHHVLFTRCFSFLITSEQQMMEKAHEDDGNYNNYYSSFTTEHILGRTFPFPTAILLQ